MGIEDIGITKIGKGRTKLHELADGEHISISCSPTLGPVPNITDSVRYHIL